MNPIFGLIHSFTGGKDDSNKKRTSKNTSPSCVVDNSIEISNVYILRRDFVSTINAIQLFSKNIF